MVAGRYGPHAYWSDREGKGSTRRTCSRRALCEKSQAQFFDALARKQKAGTIVPALFASIESAVGYCALACSVPACGVGVASAVALACTAMIA